MNDQQWPMNQQRRFAQVSSNRSHVREERHEPCNVKNTIALAVSFALITACKRSVASTLDDLESLEPATLRDQGGLKGKIDMRTFVVVARAAQL